MSQEISENSKIDEFYAYANRWIFTRKNLSDGSTSIQMKLETPDSAIKGLEDLIYARGLSRIIEHRSGTRNFLISQTKVRDSVFLDLKAAEIEDGGPQPRIKVTIDSVMNLADQIEKDGKHETIICYPSPLNKGKYRIVDGHRRHTAIFSILHWPTIRAEVKNMTESQAWAYAISANNSQERFTEFELGKTLYEGMQKFPDEYPTQQSLIDRFPCLTEYGITNRSRISQLIADYKLKAGVIEEIDPKNVTKVTKISERITREIHKVPKTILPFLLEEIVNKKLNPEQTRLVAEKIKDKTDSQNSLTKEEVGQTVEQILNQENHNQNSEEEAKRIAEARAQIHMKTAGQEIAKTGRLRDKIVVAGQNLTTQDFPEPLMVAVFGHLGLKNNGKVTPDKAKAYASILIAVIFNHAVSSEKLQDFFAEADLWQQKPNFQVA